VVKEVEVNVMEELEVLVVPVVGGVVLVPLVVSVVLAVVAVVVGTVLVAVAVLGVHADWSE